MTSTTKTSSQLQTSYLIGFGLAILLTAIPFAIVGFGLMPARAALIVIAILAVVQVLVHLYFFLHLDPRSAPGENILALGFAVVLVFIMIGGSLWIMFDLNYRMMM
jgi:cytochrome o ubiquinol oxidase operon protein cyoD